MIAEYTLGISLYNMHYSNRIKFSRNSHCIHKIYYFLKFNFN